jgi:hypothetical protein
MSACGGSARPTVITDSGFDVHPETKIEVYETGGFAGVVSDWVIVKETGAFAFSRRRSCGDTGCPAPSDSARGTLSHATADSLFAEVERDTLGLGAADFGSTKGGADMISYVLRLGVNGDVRADARADDGTMPPAMRRIVSAVHDAISAARK